MAKNQKNFIPQAANSKAIQYNGTQTSIAAPMPLWQAGSEGGKLYGIRCNFINNSGFVSDNKVFWSVNGAAPFVEIFTFGQPNGNTAAKLLFTDFWTNSLVNDGDGNKYLNFEAGGGFFVDLAQNGATVDVEAYGENY